MKFDLVEVAMREINNNCPSRPPLPIIEKAVSQRILYDSISQVNPDSDQQFSDLTTAAIHGLRYGETLTRTDSYEKNTVQVGNLKKTTTREYRAWIRYG